ncbi:uncharacterized protein J4E92_000692 [Alternaria infectoria]|uniref:uncharacterized protein n=1 Tax=Alternaria infectoria TaxID=45303 RepID=UPI00221EE2FF|nr:uncharacterized protein J4E92_000692 [Alternaria infectoria]KAI4939407.1 hypothetical protein J4E92_000692 [Alternaria infectoria]
MARRTQLLFAGFSILTLVYLFCHNPYAYISSTSHSQQPPPSLPPANSTLGFGAILAVSHSSSPRRPSLLWAANLTDIEIVIPRQKEWGVGDVEKLKTKEGSSLSTGSAKAWMGHLEALRWFLASSHETVLIIEDDTDFDIFIRQSQVPLLASAVRSLLDKGVTDDSSSSYWASTTSWDLLYPGHCDDLISTAYLSQPSLLYRDPTGTGRWQFGIRCCSIERV